MFAIKYEKPRNPDPEEDMEKDQEEIRDENENEEAGADGDLTQDEPRKRLCRFCPDRHPGAIRVCPDRP